MSEIIFYATKKDIAVILNWINADAELAWIIKESEHEKNYKWLAVSSMDNLVERRTYSLWHTKSSPLIIPAKNIYSKDIPVAAPFKGWYQTLKYDNASSPCFGKLTPTLFFLEFCQFGCETPNSIGRSGFFWLGDKYKSLGRPAHPEAKNWWKKLKRFVSKNAEAIPWGASGQYRAYVFPEAFDLYNQGTHLDINPYI